jgi:hypothetical protein
MSEEEPQFDLSSLVSDAFPDRIVSNWVVIAETVSADSRTMQIATSENMTTWLATGMLSCAQDIVMNQHYEVEDDDDDD